jgi:hypothetical protein
VDYSVAEPARGAMTRVSPRFWGGISSQEHAGTADLGADGDSGQSLSHQQRITRSAPSIRTTTRMN